jgi:hypothetical protein
MLTHVRLDQRTRQALQAESPFDGRDDHCYRSILVRQGIKLVGKSSPQLQPLLQDLQVERLRPSELLRTNVSTSLRL